jgi:hypothetical protein
MSSPFTQAAPLPAAGELVAARFRYWQYRTLIATMFGYAHSIWCAKT